MSEFSTLVQEYYKNPINNYRMEDAMISRHEGNAVCGDDITIYMKFETPVQSAIASNNQHTNDGESIVDSTMAGENLPADLDPRMQSVVTARTYDGNVSMVTQAAASFFSEIIIGKTFEEILSLDENLMIENGFDVSPRRRRARVISLVATRNAIHTFLQDGKEDSFDEVLID